jgi:hypothetical protein
MCNINTKGNTHKNTQKKDVAPSATKGDITTI